MAEVTYKYTSVSDPNSQWTSEANVTDVDETNYAYDTVSKNSVGSNIIGTVNECDGTDLGTITKVEMLFKVGTEVGEESYMDGLLAALYNGTTEGTTYITDFPTDGNPVTYSVDITNETNAPATWTWSDVQNLDMQTKGDNNASSNDISYRCYVLWVRVTYTPDVEDKSGANAMMGFNF